MLRLPQPWCQPSWQLGLTTVTQSSQAFHDWRLIHFNVFIMRRPDLLQDRNSGPHHSSPPEPTLASDQVPHYLQALRAQAPGASWSQPCVPVGHDDIRRWPAWPWETEILQQRPIWAFTVETKVRWAEFLALRTKGIELFSSVQSPGTHKHWYFQKTVENSPF